MSLEEILEVYKKYDVCSGEETEHGQYSPKTSFHSELLQVDYQQDNCLVVK